MISRKHKQLILAIVLAVAAACSYITLNSDYNACRANGNSDAMCTGRG